MKIKLDENLPTRLAPLLESIGHQVDTVAEEGLTGKPDAEVWAAPPKRKAGS
jgi:predicted nuclease of predicted toxin-antitoxin system